MKGMKKLPQKQYINYFSARPNPGAGIGHQMANWIAGYWFSKQFGLLFAHIPFSTSRIPYTSSPWEYFLGFGQGEITVEELVERRGYQLVRIPLFNEKQKNELEMIRCIIRSYTDQKTVFLAEQDQFYEAQYGVMDTIQKKFYAAPVERGKLVYEKDKGIHIAVHVRRGDVTKNSSNPNIQMRWLDLCYYEEILKQIVLYLSEKNVHIYIFSQDIKEVTDSFSAFPNVHFCLDMNEQDTFWHLTQADVLIISKSSFSYKPALLSSGVVIAPKCFWHGYPESKRWIIVDEENPKFYFENVRDLF
ncbi:MAG: hypothetical protein HFI89_03175 [Lachnospiraceae bacterium]|nr:hypothetical protein [Lachnospiraceae bacterium]